MRRTPSRGSAGTECLRETGYQLPAGGKTALRECRNCLVPGTESRRTAGGLAAPRGFGQAEKDLHEKRVRTLTKYIVEGGKPLFGEVEISGAKNAAVAIIPAALMVNGVCRMENVPQIGYLF